MAVAKGMVVAAGTMLELVTATVPLVYPPGGIDLVSRQ